MLTHIFGVWGGAPHVSPVTPSVPVDVLRALLGRRSAYDLGHGIGKASQGLKTHLNASRVAQPLRSAGAVARHEGGYCVVMQCDAHYIK